MDPGLTPHQKRRTWNPFGDFAGIPAFLASAASSDSLQAIMLGNAASTKDETREELKTKWCTASTTQSLEGPLALKQSAWDKPLLDKIVADLLDRQPEQISQARLKAISSPHAGDWLLALNIASCGLRLDDETARVAAGLRLGVPLCEPHGCPCWAPVAADDHHGLSCHLGPGRPPRHAALNDLVFRSLVRAGYPYTKEPTGLLRTDGRRPDGQTLIPWRGGKNLVWDATVTDTLAASYLPDTSLTAGAAVERASTRKTEKYSEISSTNLFTPLALETLGPINGEGLSSFSELGQKLRATTGEMRETAFLFQRISITIQRFNAVAFRGTFAGQETDEL